MSAVLPRAPGSNKPLPGSNAQIYFSPYHETHLAFNNGSDHPIQYQNVLYQTAEHLYQAFKFLSHHPGIAQLVNGSNDPQRIAQTYDDQVRSDWPQTHLFMMEQVLVLKFSQYPGLKMELLATGDAQLIQLGSNQYWSRREDGTGANEFGKVLMKVRSKLRA